MNIKNYCMSLALLLCALVARGQENRAEVCIDFRVNKTNVDSSFSDNAIRLQEIISFLQDIRKDSTVRIVEVSFCGAASPEGSAQLNRKLAQGRLAALEKLVRQEVEIPDSIITRNESYIPWDNLKSLIADSELKHKKEILAILDEESRLVDYIHPNTHIDNRIIKLKQLDGGKVWQKMNTLFFGSMRNACMVLVTYQKEIPTVQKPVIVTDTVVVEPPAELVVIAPDTTVMVETVKPEIKQWNRRFYAKSNAVGWGMLIGNIALEMDLAKHWSATLPVYYSALNFFTSDVKFRTLCFQPEVRYWLDENNQGWFGGAHLGFAWFNYAKGEKWRYQDHDGKTPIWGGGLSAGYRMPIFKNHRWWVEFSLGAGVYSLHYDIFHNEYNGPVVDEKKATFFGIDQVKVSVAYRFNLNKKGGKQ